MKLRRTVDVLLSAMLIGGAFFPIGALLALLTNRNSPLTEGWDITLWSLFTLQFLPAGAALVFTGVGVLRGRLWARWLALVAGLALLLVGALYRGNAQFGYPLLTLSALCFLLFLNGWTLVKDGPTNPSPPTFEGGP